MEQILIVESILEKIFISLLTIKLDGLTYDTSWNFVEAQNDIMNMDQMIFMELGKGLAQIRKCPSHLKDNK